MDELNQQAGMDESGKGDLFGTPVCACVVADTATLDRLRAIGVRDSKTIDDRVELYQLETMIRQNTRVYLRSLDMPKYNRLMAKPQANLNKLLAWLHAHALHDALLEGPVAHAILDQFASTDYVSGYLRKLMPDLPENLLEQRPRAESETVVAAASICARVGYLKQMDRLSRQSGRVLLRGCSREAQAQARSFLEQQGVASFQSVTKLHFKCARRMLREYLAKNQSSEFKNLPTTMHV